MAEVKATAYKLKGNKGSISFTWKSNTYLDPKDENRLIESLENIIGHELSKI